MQSNLLHFEDTSHDCDSWKISRDRLRCFWLRHPPPQITQTFLRTSLLLACYFLNVLSCSENVFTGGYLCSCVNDWKYSVCCSWCLIKDDWKLSYWSSFVGGTFTCKWLQETQGVCLMCNVNSMLLAEASVYTHTVFFQWVNWNQSLYTWICIVCLWTN